MYDIIGDVHGQAAELKLLLKKMGYERINGIYKHPKRKAVFVGDFINRGPEIKKTIRIIRAMVESGNALAILGNHEINAIIYYYKNKKNSLLGSKQDKYFLSVHKTVNEFTSEPEEWKEHIRWLRTLPIFLDFGDIRVVHACWDDQAIAKVSDLYEEGRIRKNTFRMMYQKGDSEISKCVWLLTKGIDLRLPYDLHVVNNKGVAPRSFRMRWWEDPLGKTFRELSFESKFIMPAYTVPPQILPVNEPYPEEAPIVFFGHYCRGNGPLIVKHNICCVDSCVTGTGMLTAYRWNGEKELSMANLVQAQDS